MNGKQTTNSKSNINLPSNLEAFLNRNHTGQETRNKNQYRKARRNKLQGAESARKSQCYLQ